MVLNFFSLLSLRCWSFTTETIATPGPERQSGTAEFAERDRQLCSAAVPLGQSYLRQSATRIVRKVSALFDWFKSALPLEEWRLIEFILPPSFTTEFFC